MLRESRQAKCGFWLLFAGALLQLLGAWWADLAPLWPEALRLAVACWNRAAALLP